MSAQDLAHLAGMVADRTRATICVTLLDGRAWTATELAREAGVAPSTMSEHLSRLVDSGFIRERRQGRHRYVELASPEIADLLEHLLGFTENRPATSSFRAVSASEALTRGRTCYDHLAGRLGVTVTDAMTARGLLGEGLIVTDTGRDWLSDELSVDLTLARPRSRRPLSRACLDWTERRSHLAGAAGAAVCATFLGRGWVQRVGTGRAVRPTPTGERVLHDLLGIEPADL